MNLKELEREVVSLREKVRTLEDIEQIKTLQRAYGYYLDNQNIDDLGDLFADNATTEMGPGINEGKEKIKESLKKNMFKRNDGSKRLWVHLQFQGVINVDPDGKKANGRWQMLGLSTDYLGKSPGVLEPMIGLGVYENEYVKENNSWKIKKLTFNRWFRCKWQDGWVKETIIEPEESGPPPTIRLDIGDRTWRSGYKVPIHFKNPVTGR